MRLSRIALASATRCAIRDAFLQLARRGIDVQDFDPEATNRGTKPSVIGQRGYYGDVAAERLQGLGELLRGIFAAHGETDALTWFDLLRRLPCADRAEMDGIAPLRILHLLPNSFDAVAPEDLRSPNGLRIPESLRDPEEIREYSALLLLPKLVLAALAGLAEMSPWLDRDMDLGSTVHTIRPDADKLVDRSGYGAGHLPCHTDGYWSDESSVPVWNVMLCAANPFGEPTYFLRVADLFRVLDERHPEYQGWAASFADLRRDGQSPGEFVTWVLSEALTPQFDFVMGQIGSGAGRSVRGVPLLEKHRTLPGFLFRYKSSFSASNERAQPVVDFVNRMVALLSAEPSTLGRDVRLQPGHVVFALNGACLSVATPQRPPAGGVDYPVSGSATIHGREALRIVDGRVRRTIVRGNLVARTRAVDVRSVNRDVLEREGQVVRLLESGYRANQLQR